MREPAFGVSPRARWSTRATRPPSTFLVGDQRTVKVNRSGSDAFQRVIRLRQEGNAYGVGFFQAINDMVNAVKQSDAAGMQRSISRGKRLARRGGIGLAQIGTDMNVLDSQQVVLEETNLRSAQHPFNRRGLWTTQRPSRR